MIFNEDDRSDCQRLKWAFESCKNGAWGDEPNGETDAVCIRAADFNADLGKLNDGKRTLRSIDDTTYRKVGLRAGDLVVEKSGGGEKQLVGRSVIYSGEERVVCSNFLARCRPSDMVTSEYLNYLMLAIYKGRGTYPHIKQTTGIQNLDMVSFLNTRVRLPPFETQKRIAAFLDEKTAQIDGLIEKKRALLDLLAEKRQAIITQAVTKGLNPAAPMKDSGIDWLGQIPAHWEAANIRRFATMKTGHTPSRTVPEYWEDCTIPWFTLSDVWQLRDGTRIYIEDTAERISEVGLTTSAAELLPAGTVIFSRTASIGFSGVMPYPMATTQDFWNWICGPKLRPIYLLLLFRAMVQMFSEITSGSTHKTIYQPIAAGLEVCAPPLEEQDAISDKVTKAMSLIDDARSMVTASVDKLTEYRSALITAAVTGQIEELR